MKHHESIVLYSVSEACGDATSLNALVCFTGKYFKRGQNFVVFCPLQRRRVSSKLRILVAQYNTSLEKKAHRIRHSQKQDYFELWQKSLRSRSIYHITSKVQLQQEQLGAATLANWAQNGLLEGGGEAGASLEWSAS